MDSFQIAPVEDQAGFDTCAACCLAAALRWMRLKAGLEDLAPSRLLLHFNAHLIAEERTGHGAQRWRAVEIRDALEAAARPAMGYCPETLWPYRHELVGEEPPATVRGAVPAGSVLSFEQVPPDLNRLRAWLAAGYPVLLGCRLHSEYESPDVQQSGEIPLPAPMSQHIYNHALLLVSHDDDRGHFVVRNSLGSGWGRRGHGFLPDGYVVDPLLASERWVITMLR